MNPLQDDIDDDIALSAALWIQMQMIAACTIISPTQDAGGSRPGRSANLPRDFVRAHKMIYEHYFLPDDQERGEGSGQFGPLYPHSYFERRFRMPRSLFDTLFVSVVRDSDFIRAGLQPDATGRFGASPLQKVVAALRYIAYGSPSDSVDDYCMIGESTAAQSMKEFCHSVVHKFGHEFLRPPTSNDLVQIEKEFAAVGFPGCIGCLDCSSWDWGACPKALQGIMNGKEKSPVVRMEAICDMNMRVWHFCFGFPGSMSDLNILSVSPHFEDILAGKFPPFETLYEIAGEQFDWVYYLTDGIYPNWKIFISSISNPSSRKEKNFKSIQSAVRKSVERVFGVLLKRFGIIAQPSRLWYSENMTKIMQACIIIHNQLIELRKDDFVWDGIGRIRTAVLSGIAETASSMQITTLPHAGSDLPVQQTTDIAESIKSLSERTRLLNALIDHIDSQGSML